MIKTMASTPTKKEVYRYFRMGLVTGLLDQQAVAAWADQEILQSEIPDIEAIELSGSGRLSYSQLIGYLFDIQGEPNYDLPLKMIFARAGMALEEDPGRARAILLGLRLLKAEEFLSKDVKAQLTELEKDLELFERKKLPAEELTERLARFLRPYRECRTLLEQEA